MKRQSRIQQKLALHKETVRTLDRIELAGANGGSIVIPHTNTCPTARICLTTATTTTLRGD